MSDLEASAEQQVGDLPPSPPVESDAATIDPADAANTDAAVAAAAAAPAAPTRRRRWRRLRDLDRGLVIACGVIGVGMSLIVFGFFVAVTGNEGINRPEAIERLSPVENAIQVLQQESIIVDLEFGWEARLILDGVEIETTILGQTEVAPGEDGGAVTADGDADAGAQLSIPPTAVFDRGNSVLTFTPTEGAAFEELSEGLHTATIFYWRTEEGPETARSYTWTFNVV